MNDVFCDVSMETDEAETSRSNSDKLQLVQHNEEYRHDVELMEQWSDVVEFQEVVSQKKEESGLREKIHQSKTIEGRLAQWKNTLRVCVKKVQKQKRQNGGGRG